VLRLPTLHASLLFVWRCRHYTQDIDSALNLVRHEKLPIPSLPEENAALKSSMYDPGVERGRIASSGADVGVDHALSTHSFGHPVIASGMRCGISVRWLISWL
jgi:hypothetical protein